MGLNQLKEILARIDGKGYKAYKEIQGTYIEGQIQYHLDYIQVDPFANPSRVRVAISQRLAGFEPETYHLPHRKVGLEDFLARSVAQVLQTKQGSIRIDEPGQEVLPRTAVKVEEEFVEVRLTLSLPAAGRTILGKQAIQTLCRDLPALIQVAILEVDRAKLKKQLELCDQQRAIRDYLDREGYVAFVQDGAILPRESGRSNRPLQGDTLVPFLSPDSLRVSIPIPHRELPITGMAIRPGVTLIVGGGYHGKSTLLKAIERGVYNHTLGDGREFVITNETACKVRAEDGRRVEKVNISPFISHLPFGQDTEQFSTEDASGSTSQAANIMEALEMGCQLLLIDEDTSATNFMIRDARMQALVSKGKEPITPFIDQVRHLYDEHHISTILVIGGSGDYFDVADCVVMMEEYQAKDATVIAKEIANRILNARKKEEGMKFGELALRTLSEQSFDRISGPKVKVEAKGMDFIQLGTAKANLRYLEQLVDPSQSRAIVQIVRRIAQRVEAQPISLREAIEHIFREIDNEGIDIISPYKGKHPGDLALPRPFEVAAAINRLSSLYVASVT